MPTEQNPFDRAYAAIVAAWKAWPPLMAKVKALNIQNQQSPPYQPQLNVNAGDRVELKLGEKRLSFKPFTVNALGSFFAAEYPIQVASGQLSLSTINLVLWEVGRSLANAGPYLGIDDIAGKWELAGDASLTPNDPQAKRPDWTAIAAVRVEFNLRRDAYLSADYT